MDAKKICCDCRWEEGTPDGCVTLCPLHAAAEGMRVLILRNLARLETGKVNLDEFTWVKDARALLKQLEDS